ncbi:hypothetical protein M513_03953 [Trichuris suis]|uniref:Uncharacterized protein n=1 Tax=Trichuris suis TaxID=68888 RepID=A0A085MDL6_9BILA|nr:hypothetical protein M513_03953 [Trichuris suis]
MLLLFICVVAFALINESQAGFSCLKKNLPTMEEKETMFQQAMETCTEICSDKKRRKTLFRGNYEECMALCCYECATVIEKATEFYTSCMRQSGKSSAITKT